MAKRSWSVANDNSNGVGTNISTAQTNPTNTIDQPVSARSHGRSISFGHQDSFLDPMGNHQNSGDDASPNSVLSSTGAQGPSTGSVSAPDHLNKRARKSGGNEKPVGLQDDRPPTTPRTRACAACRKQKIKCILENDQSRCTRCIRRNLSCELNRSLQSLVDEQRQIDMLRNDVVHLHEKLTAACGLLDMALPAPLQISQDNSREHLNGDSTQLGDLDGPENMGEDSLPMSPDGPAQAPIESFLNIAKLGSPQATNQEADRGSKSKTAPEPDIISRGIVSLATAERLVDRYFSRLDHYIWASGYQYTDLQSLRKASPMLLACICTVSALHEIDDGQLYEVCNQEFRRLMSKSLFEKRDIEYLRGLIVGSYWLSDISRIISSGAIRRAVDMRLQKFLYTLTDPESNAPQGALRSLDEATKMDRVRLWYLLYIEDQHLSILYNRDPIMREQERVLNHEAFLESTHSTDADVRMISQVTLLLIMSQIRETFGPDMGEQVPKNLTPQLNNFSRQIDHWYARWSPLFKPNEHIATFPSKGLMMHFNFAKVYLGHHVFRGLSHPHSTGTTTIAAANTAIPSSSTSSLDPPTIPTHLKPTALMAHSSALAILDLLLVDLDLQKSLLGMPAYYHIMITFAANFLLASSAYHDQLAVAQDTAFSLVADVINLLQSTRCIAQHPLRRMSGGLARKLDACVRSARSDIGRGTATTGVMNGVNGGLNGVSALVGGDLSHQSATATTGTPTLGVYPTQGGETLGWSTTTASTTTSATTPGVSAGLLPHMHGNGGELPPSYFDGGNGPTALGGGFHINPEFDLNFLEFEDGDYLGFGRGF